MNWATTILAVLKLIAIELPKIIESWRKYQKDTKYKTTQDKIDAARKDYTRKKSLEALRKFENTQ